MSKEENDTIYMYIKEISKFISKSASYAHTLILPNFTQPMAFTGQIIMQHQINFSMIFLLPHAHFHVI